MRTNDKLIGDYNALLRAHGLHPSTTRTENLDDFLRDIHRSEERFGPTPDQVTQLLREAWTNSGIEDRAVNYPQEIVQAQAKEVEQLIERSYGKRAFSDRPIYAAEFPTGTLGAQAVETQHGFLVLVNVGLIHFLEQTLVLMYGHLLRWRREKSRQSDADAAEILYCHLITYLTGRIPPPPNIDVSPFETDLQTRILYSYFKNACLKFILGHEYAHIAAGHFEETKEYLPLSTCVGNLTVLRKSWLQEFEADEIATRALLAERGEMTPDLKSIGLKIHPTLTYRAAAPVFFFLLDELLTTVWYQDRRDKRRATVRRRSSTFGSPPRECCDVRDRSNRTWKGRAWIQRGMPNMGPNSWGEGHNESSSPSINRFDSYPIAGHGSLVL